MTKADPAGDVGERFFKELADFALVMMRRSGPNALCDWFNKPWLDFVGATMEQEIGNGWAESVHPDILIVASRSTFHPSVPGSRSR